MIDKIVHGLSAVMPLWLWGLIVAGALNEVVNRAKWTRAESILQAIGSFLLWLPGMGPVLAKTPLAGAILRRIAGVPEDAGKIPLPPASVLLPFLLLPLLASSCLTHDYCVSHPNDNRCKAQQGVNCAAPTVIGEIVKVLPIIVTDLLAQRYNSILTDIAPILQADGISDVGAIALCAVQNANVNLNPPKGAELSPEAVVLKSRLQACLFEGCCAWVKR